ncbi:hypothetical protein FXW04_05665 [Staphylococcus pseudintermedius]|nr:hypothetical protein [Staphylococcus pseudintermedius]
MNSDLVEHLIENDYIKQDKNKNVVFNGKIMRVKLSVQTNEEQAINRIKVLILQVIQSIHLIFLQ